MLWRIDMSLNLKSYPQFFFQWVTADWWVFPEKKDDITRKLFIRREKNYRPIVSRFVDDNKIKLILCYSNNLTGIAFYYVNNKLMS